MIFTRQDDNHSIEEFITYCKKICPNVWTLWIWMALKDDARSWWELLNHDKIRALSTEDFEKLVLDTWSRAKNKGNANCNSLSSFKVHRGFQMESLKEIQLDVVKQDNRNTNVLFLGGISLLHVHGCIQ